MMSRNEPKIGQCQLQYWKSHLVDQPAIVKLIVAVMEIQTRHAGTLTRQVERGTIFISGTGTRLWVTKRISDSNT